MKDEQTYFIKKDKEIEVPTNTKGQLTPTLPLTHGKGWGALYFSGLTQHLYS
jgi:hypothetical protein